MYQFSSPHWKPLLEIAGELTQWFMWMTEIELGDGRRLHAYKHRVTRRYLHLSNDGEAFAYLGVVGDRASDRYQAITRAAALREAFAGWDELTLDPSDGPAQRAALAAAIDHAERGITMPFDPEWLTRQERFDAEVRRATLQERSQDPRYRGALASANGDEFFGDLDDRCDRPSAA
jgi:hypothetical protein